MLAIKLERVGKKHQATFRLVVDEERHKIHGRHVDYLGWYDPRQNKYDINKEKALQWLKNGAHPTASVHNLLIRAGIIRGKKMAVHKKPKPQKEGEAK